jgi:hypothetical protein
MLLLARLFVPDGLLWSKSRIEYFAIGWSIRHWYAATYIINHLQCNGVVPITTTIEGSKMCLEYHIFHHPGPTFILVGVPLRLLLRGTDNGECLKMAVGHQEFSTSFTRTVNHAVEDELEGDLLQQVMTTTLEEELSPPCLDNVADYFSLPEEEAEFQDLDQGVKPETSPVELK